MSRNRRFFNHQFRNTSMFDMERNYISDLFLILENIAEIISWHLQSIKIDSWNHLKRLSLEQRQ